MIKQGDKVIVTITKTDDPTILRDLPAGEYVGWVHDTTDKGIYVLLRQVIPQLLEFNQDYKLTNFPQVASIRPAIAVRSLLGLLLEKTETLSIERMESISIWHYQRASADKKKEYFIRENIFDEFSDNNVSLEIYLDAASKGLYYSLKAEEELGCFKEEVWKK